MASYSATSEEVTGITDYVKTMFGYPVVQVELSANQYTHAFNSAIEEYSHYITQWAIKGNIANALGLPSAQDFTQRWVAQNFEFAKSFSKAYSEQANIGGEVPIRKSYFTLQEDKQVYYLDSGITINEVMWQEPPAINRYLTDPNNNPAWVNFEFGWGYMGHSYMYIVPAYYSIQLANATEMRWRLWKGDYSYIVRPAPADGTRVSPDYTGQTKNAVHIFPTPRSANEGTRVWYFYKNDEDSNLYSAQTENQLVNNPGTIQMNEIPYSSFNSSSKRWVKQYTLATCKEILGRIRSKFSELPIPDGTVTLDGESLISEGQENQKELKEYLFNELEAMDVGKLIEDDANAAENINRSLSFNPMGILIG